MTPPERKQQNPDEGKLQEKKADSTNTFFFNMKSIKGISASRCDVYTA